MSQEKSRGFLCAKRGVKRHDLHTKNNYCKIYGRRMELIVEHLERHRQPTFTLDDVYLITGMEPDSARSLLARAVRRGQIRRLKPGTYSVPATTSHPFAAVAALLGDAPYFMSHDSAFEFHLHCASPPSRVTISCTRRMRRRVIDGCEYRFAWVPPDKFFGESQLSSPRTGLVVVSDLERTIIDGLRQPQYTGGIAQVAQALCALRPQLYVQRLFDYALRLEVGAVISRLGFLFEHCKLAEQHWLWQLRRTVGHSKHLLDPTLPASGKRDARWGLICNLDLPPARYSHSIVSGLSNLLIHNCISNHRIRNTVRITVSRSCLAAIDGEGCDPVQTAMYRSHVPRSTVTPISTSMPYRAVTDDDSQ